MTVRQTLLQWFYPLLMRLAGKKAMVLKNEKNIQPLHSFYQLQTILNNGSELNFKSLRGKKVLLVNTASDCGYTAQYKELQQLYEQHKNNLEIIAFPANDFKKQEKSDDEAIAAFCQNNYGVTFPLVRKSVVVKSSNQNEVFKWLSDKNLNGWNDQPPKWNFSKYLIDERGLLTHYFDPSVAPTSAEITGAIRSFAPI